MKAGLWARGSWMNDALDIFQSSAAIVCVWSSEAKHVLFCSGENGKNTDAWPMVKRNQNKLGAICKFKLRLL